MLRDIARQGEILARLAGRGDEVARFAAAHLAPGPVGARLAFGSGDGWFAARAVWGAGGVSGLDFLLNRAPRLGPQDRVLAISMSGNVDRTVEGMQAALAAGAQGAILTNGAGGRIAALGVPALSLGIPDLAPFLCGTSSYTAMVAVLRMIGDPAAAAAIAALAPRIGALVDQADALARQIATPFPGVRFLGVGPSIATADYAAAKCVEVARLPVWSDDIEEFAHRQYWAMARGELVVLLPVDAASAVYADATADALADLDTPTLALEPTGAAVPRARWRLALPGGAAEAPITQAIAVQLLAYRLGFATGTDPNRRLHLKDDTARFAVSRKLTRRSLLGTGQ
jgi:fructoselysine-6-P-deglycase FrlB-like protein